MRIFRLAVLGHHRYEIIIKNFQVHVKYCTMIDSKMGSNENVSVRYPFNGVLSVLLQYLSPAAIS